LRIVGTRSNEDSQCLVDEFDACGHVHAVHGEQRKKSGVTQRNRAIRAHARAQALLDRVGLRQEFDLSDHELDHRVEHVRLAGKVVIQAHRLHPERFAELARAETLQPVAVDLHQCLGHDALARERDAPGGRARTPGFARRRAPQIVLLSDFHGRPACNLTP